jgi:hypothetical protein
MISVETNILGIVCCESNILGIDDRCPFELEGTSAAATPMFDGKKHGFLPMFPYINQYKPI